MYSKKKRLPSSEQKMEMFLSVRELLLESGYLLVGLAQKGIEKILVVSPSFVTDCLETIIEIQHEYQELFIKNGGEKLTLVSSASKKITYF